MKINYSLSTKVNSDGKQEIHLRFIGNKTDVFRGKTGLYISASNWANGKPKTNSRIPAITTECRHLTSKLTNLSTKLIDAYNGSKNHDKEWMTNMLHGLRWEGDEPILSGITSFSCALIQDSFIAMIDERLSNGVIQKSTYNAYKKTWVYMCDFNARYKYRVCDVNKDTMPKIISFIAGLRKRGKQISDNTLFYNRKVLALWWNWCCTKDDSLKPAAFPKMKPITYGTPFYLDKEMRDALLAAKMPTKTIEQARDIFILQCYIGCRFSDLLAMTQDNIVDGSIQYIAKKTISHEPHTIVVPLHPVALMLIEKMKGRCGNYLIPRVRTTTINNQLKFVFAACPDADKPVTIRDKHTGQQVITTIGKVASTHMARRTFIGILYELGFRESDICSLSGHKEGSVSIQRYRKVSDAIKQNMIDSL